MVELGYRFAVMTEEYMPVGLRMWFCYERYLLGRGPFLEGSPLELSTHILEKRDNE
jgi:hypothetical protein